jgi:hypothetical protein
VYQVFVAENSEVRSFVTLSPRGVVQMSQRIA